MRLMRIRLEKLFLTTLNANIIINVLEEVIKGD
jgi:hypothetical protein